MINQWLSPTITNDNEFDSQIRGKQSYFNKADLYAGQEATVRTGHGTTDWF